MAYKSAEPIKSRKMSEGDHLVVITEVKPFMANLDFKLNGKDTIQEITMKDNFNKAFNQGIVVVIFKNEAGEICSSRRSLKGWLTNSDTDRNKQIIATPAYIKEHGLTPVEDEVTPGLYRFIGPDGKGFAGDYRTSACSRINDQLCHAVGLPVGSSLLDIPVGAKCLIRYKRVDSYPDKITGEMKERFDVTAFAHPDEGFAVEPVATVTGTTTATKSTLAPVPAPAPDDLPF
jgi:hypothetical protein